LSVLSLFLGAKKGLINKKQLTKYISALEKLPQQVEEILSDNKKFKQLLKNIINLKMFYI